MADLRGGADAAYLREGGRIDLCDGTRLVWSVAEGRRGRRWRAVASHQGVVTDALLLEVDPAGRPSRLELATPTGLLTLHPEPDERSIHGNVVSAAGIRPLAYAWSHDHELDVVGRPLVIACGLHRRRAALALGGEIALTVLQIDASLGAAPGVVLAGRVAEDRWTLRDATTDERRGIALDAAGLPIDALRWPLEP